MPSASLSGVRHSGLQTVVKATMVKGELLNHIALG
ncbi:hypothetical protein CRE_00184 [Caenorhabditis remanei]|uniref:Uncharacterized protein n=1 Tax=Caenorhabditis remanei TaxID=31234 RepID=E3LDM8_CAERE|nr:hypothetical protein CRE_00184 [Caenorhabditis remanei]